MNQINISGLPLLYNGALEQELPLPLQFTMRQSQGFTFGLGINYFTDLPPFGNGPTAQWNIRIKVTEAYNKGNLTVPTTIKPSGAVIKYPSLFGIDTPNYNSGTSYNTIGTVVKYNGTYYRMVSGTGVSGTPDTDPRWVKYTNNVVGITLPNDLVDNWSPKPEGSIPVYGIVLIEMAIRGFDHNLYLGSYSVAPTKTYKNESLVPGHTFYNTEDGKIYKRSVFGTWNELVTTSPEEFISEPWFIASKGLIKIDQYVPGSDPVSDVSNVVTLINDFGKLYLGAKSSDPTLDNQNMPLKVGASYFNTTINAVKYWSGNGWVTPQGGQYAPINSPDFTGLVQVPAGITVKAQDGGDEGAEINLTKPANSSFAGNVAIDLYQSKLRIFETGGDYRGVFLDLGQWLANVGSELWHSGNLNPNSLGGIQPVNVTASEDLAAGDFVNIFYTGGSRYCQKASASSPVTLAHGFVKEAVISGQPAAVYPGGLNVYASGTFLDETVFLSSTPGLATITPPETSGFIVQEIGVATGPNSIYFQYNPPIKLA